MIQEPKKRHEVSSTSRAVPFPRRLHMMIVSEAIRHPVIVRWSADGRAFFVDDDKVFVNEILPQYGFKASKMQSFQVHVHSSRFQNGSMPFMTSQYGFNS